MKRVITVSIEKKNLFQSSVYEISPSTHFANTVSVHCSRLMATCCGRECKSSHRHLSEPRILLCLCSFIFSSSLHQAFIRSSCCGSQQLSTGNYPARAERLPSQSAFPRTVGPDQRPVHPHPSRHTRPSLNLGASAPP